MHRNPATSAAQYGMAQAVLSGASSAMPVDVARELVDKTPARLRSKYARELHHNPGRFTDHYTKGTRDTSKLPKRVQEYPASYDNELRDFARKYANKYSDKHADESNTDAYIEYYNGLRDALYKNSAKYGVFEFRGDGQYQQSTPRETFASESLARKWMSEHLSHEEHFYGGKEGRGFVVRRANEQHARTGNPPNATTTFDSRRSAEAYKRLVEAEGHTATISKSGVLKPKWTVITQLARAGNPADSSAAMFESFHGAPSTGTLVIQDDLHYHEHLAELGVLCGLKVRTVNGDDYTISFVAKGQASNPRRKGKGKGKKRGPFSDAYQFSTELVPGILQGADQVLGNPRSFTSYDSAVKWMQQHATGETTFRSPTPSSKNKTPFYRTYVYIPHDGDYTVDQIDTKLVPGILESADSLLGNPRTQRENEILAEIRETKKEMKDLGYKIMSFMNRQPIEQGRYNERLFRLKTELARVQHLSGARGWVLTPVQPPAKPNPSSDSGPVILCSNERGNQLYFRGGDQSLDLSSMKLSDLERDCMNIGEVWAIAYSTKKAFDNFQEIEYVHGFGDEKSHPHLPKRADLWEDAQPPEKLFGTGELPTLTYDTLNKALGLIGGVYKIDKPLLSTSPGIEN